MTRTPEDIAFGATASGAVLATSAAVALIIYAMLVGAGLLPSPRVSTAQDVVQFVSQAAYR